MPYKVTIAAGLDNVVVGGRGPFTAGDVVLLTDEEFANMKPSGFGTLFAATPVAINTGDAQSGYPYT